MKKGRDTRVAIIICLYVSYLNMLILLHSTSFILILKFPIEYNQSDKNKTNNNHKYSIYLTIMWFISRCISIDSLNTCFQQQKHKTSYDFCLCNEGSRR